jgi:hypothetical protein
VLFALCGPALLVLWQIHRAWDRSPPDAGGFAHSDTTRTADTAAAPTSSARLADLTAALPGTVPLGTSVADSCRTHDQNPLIGARALGAGQLRPQHRGVRRVRR